MPATGRTIHSDVEVNDLGRPPRHLVVETKGVCAIHLSDELVPLCRVRPPSGASGSTIKSRSSSPSSRWWTEPGRCGRRCWRRATAHRGLLYRGSQSANIGPVVWWHCVDPRGLAAGMPHPESDVQLATSRDEQLRVNFGASLQVFMYTVLGLGFHLEHEACERALGRSQRQDGSQCCQRQTPAKHLQRGKRHGGGG